MEILIKYSFGFEFPFVPGTLNWQFTLGVSCGSCQEVESNVHEAQAFHVKITILDTKNEQKLKPIEHQRAFSLEKKVI